MAILRGTSKTEYAFRLTIDWLHATNVAQFTLQKTNAMYDNRIILGLRSLARRTGFNKIAGTLIGLLGYENAFGKAVLTQIRPGDCIWDVGANLGLYSGQFLERAGANGKVIAFEPSRECFEALRSKLEAQPGFTGINAALGSADGNATLFCATDPLAATHTLSADAGKEQAHAGSTYVVPVFSADSFALQNPSLKPNVIKIDVEGFEASVMEGLDKLLHFAALRAIFIEVHFTLLEAQGKKDAPRVIVQKLRDAGFTVSWPDPSHIGAVRPSA